MSKKYQIPPPNLTPDYVRVDTKEDYIYLKNDTMVRCGIRGYTLTGTPYYGYEMRSQYLLKNSYACIRMTRKRTIPTDKKINVWYSKQSKEKEN